MTQLIKDLKQTLQPDNDNVADPYKVAQMMVEILESHGRTLEEVLNTLGSHNKTFESLVKGVAENAARTQKQIATMQGEINRLKGIHGA